MNIRLGNLHNKSLQRTLGMPAHFAAAKYTVPLMAAEFHDYLRVVVRSLWRLGVFMGLFTFSTLAYAGGCNYSSVSNWPNSNWQLEFASDFDVIFVGKVTSVDPPYEQDRSLPRTKDIPPHTKVATVKVTETLKGLLSEEVSVKFGVGWSGSPMLSVSGSEILFYSNYHDNFYSASICTVFHLSSDRESARKHGKAGLRALREFFRSDVRT